MRAGGHVTEPRGADWSVASGPRLEGRAFAPLSSAAGGEASLRELGWGRLGRVAVRSLSASEVLVLWPPAAGHLNGAELCALRA